MGIIKKKIKVVSPEVKCQEASLIVEQQQNQFTTMIEEVEEAIQIRSEAVTEAEKEAQSLEAQLRNKNNLIENAKAQSMADSGFIKRLKEMRGY